MELSIEAIHRLEAERNDLKDKHLRTLAEYENFRRRTSRERVELSDRAQAGLAIRLLEVLDDLDRLAAQDQAMAPEAVHQAVLLIDRKLRKELEAAGLERIDPQGQPFDPAQHDAVSMVPAPAPDRDHVVSATFQAGYRFKGNLIRPAKVQVWAHQG